MYLTKEELEVRILEALDDVVFYNGKRLDEILPVEERAQICVDIINNLPMTMPDLITKYHNDRGGDSTFNLKKVYYHLFEEMVELGLELGINDDEIYKGFLDSYIYTINKSKNKPTTKENLLRELADVTLIVGHIAKLVNMDDILFDGILSVLRSLNTKLCKSLDEVRETVKEQNLSYSTITTIELGNGKYLMIDSETGKSIKPVSFEPPDFKHIFNNLKK